MSRAPRVACIVNGGVGDQILALPALRLLSHHLGPGALDVLLAGAERRGELYRTLAGPTLRVLLQQEWRARYDFAIELDFSPSCSVPSTLWGEARFVCFDKPGVPPGALLVPRRAPFWRAALALGQRLLEALELPVQVARGNEDLFRTGLPLPPCPSASERLRAWFPERERRRPIVAVSPGGCSPPEKIWPWRRFAAVSAELARRAVGVVLLGAPNERELCQTIAREAEALAPGVEPPRALDVPLADLGYALLRCDAHLSNDNGAAHVAGALHVPQVVLYRGGPEHNAHPTLGFRDRTLYSGLLEAPSCMEPLGVERVLSELLDVLTGLGWPAPSA